jgi:DNA repair protein SbcD/Mre11
MKVLHFADVHLDTAFAWAPAPVASGQRQAIRAALRRICEVAREEHVDALTSQMQGSWWSTNFRFT